MTGPTAAAHEDARRSTPEQALPPPPARYRGKGSSDERGSLTNVFEVDSESSQFLKEYVEGKEGQRDTLETAASGKKLRMREAGKGGGAGRRGAEEGQGGSGGAHTHTHAGGAAAPSHLAVRKGVKGEAGKKGSLGMRAAANAGGVNRERESLGDDATEAADESAARLGATSCPPFVRLFDQAGAAILSQALEDKALFADEILGDKRGRYHINHRSLLIRPVRILPFTALHLSPPPLLPTSTRARALSLAAGARS